MLLHLNGLFISIIFVCVYRQVLSLVTPKPTEVIRTSAFRSPDVNRSTDFLPRETKCDNKSADILKITIVCF